MPRSPGACAEARADRDDVRLEVEHAIDAPPKSIVPAAVSSSGSVMYSGAIAATIGTHERGVATVTRPAPERSAPSAARCAAPVLPERAGDDQHAAEVALVRVGRARRDQLAHALARQQLEARAFELVEHRERECRCRR